MTPARPELDRRAFAKLALGAALFVAPGPRSRAQTRIKVTAAYVGVASDIGLYVADKKGYFRDEGLDVALTMIDQTNRMIPTLGTGDLDVGSGTIAASLYNAVGRDIALRVVAEFLL